MGLTLVHYVELNSVWTKIDVHKHITNYTFSVNSYNQTSYVSMLYTQVDWYIGMKAGRHTNRNRKILLVCMYVYMMCAVCVYMFLSALTVDLESKQNYKV